MTPPTTLTRLCGSSLLVLLSLVCATGSAAAQGGGWESASPAYQPPPEVAGEVVDDPPNPLLMPRLRLGFYGMFAPPPEVTDARSGDTRETVDLPVGGLGFQVAAVVPLLPNLAVGARGAMLASVHDRADYDINGEGDQRSWDASFLVELRLPWGPSGGFYMHGFAGAALTRWLDDIDYEATGFVTGGAFGFDAIFGGHFGFYYEVGFTHRNVVFGGSRELRVVTYELNNTMGLVLSL